jgi:membrane dipeptidase
LTISTISPNWYAISIALFLALDGLFDTEQTPYNMDIIAGIARFETILFKRGYAQKDIENIHSITG